jgi:Protein of unknown function (DUF1552)
MMFNRRNFSKLIVSAPVAAALRSFSAEAQMKEVPRRIVLFFTPHGTVWSRWRPQGNPTVNNFTLPYILEPLKKFQSKLSLLDGVGLPSEGPGAPHTRGPAVLFTGSPLANDGTFNRGDCSGGCTFGWNTSHSVDHEIATRLGKATPYNLLTFSVQAGSGFPGSHISYADKAKPNVARDNPIDAWKQLFGGLSTSVDEQKRKLSRRLNVLSTVQGDLAGLKGTIGRADQQRLDSHAQALAELEQALTAQRESCSLPTAPNGKSEQSPDWRPWAMDRQIELMTASLACGLTRVSSLQFRPGENDGGAQGIYSWLGQSEEHHLSTHDTGAASLDRISAIYRWYSERFAYLLERLDSFPEADGTLLDHTLVVWGSEIGDGSTHDISNIPFVVAGGGKRGVKGGRYLKLPQGTMNHRLLVSMLHYMGYTDAQKFGNVDKGAGPLAGLL